MQKLGRNDPCPCGSGKKYKKCHYGYYNKSGQAMPPPGLLEVAEKLKNLPLEPFEKGGFLTGRPFIDHVFKEQRFRAVGNRVYKRPLNETFHEFLLDTLAESLGRKWLHDEFQKPLGDSHTLAIWYKEVVEQMQDKESVAENPKVFSIKNTGNIRTLLSIAYDFYSLAHCGGNILPGLLKRLKNKEFFQGAKYEIAMGGMVVRAGFDIKWVNIKEKHVEFIGRHKTTNDEAAFEAKSHYREGVFGKGQTNFDPEKFRIKIMDHIKEALEQSPKDLPLVIFDDLNLPLSNIPTKEKRWFKEVDDDLKRFGFLQNYKETNFGGLFITNFAWYFHQDLSLMKENETMNIFHIGGKYSLNPQTIGLLDTSAKQYGFVPSKLDEFGIKIP